MADRSEVETVCRRLTDLRRQIADLGRSGSVPPGLLQALLDETEDPLFIVDDEARIVMVNVETARLLGMPPRELERSTSWDLTHASYQADFDVLWKEFQRAGKQSGQYGLRHMNGSLVEVAYCAERNVLPGRS